MGQITKFKTRVVCVFPKLLSVIYSRFDKTLSFSHCPNIVVKNLGLPLTENDLVKQITVINHSNTQQEKISE